MPYGMTMVRALYHEGAIQDITERKKAEEALRKSEERYRTVLESIEEGYYEVDLKGNFIFLNDSMCRIWGYPKEELMGINNRLLVDAETAEKEYQIFNKIYTTGESVKGYHHEIIRKDRTRGYIEGSASILKDISGTPVGFRGISRDITERKKAEEQLRKSEETARQLSGECDYCRDWTNCQFNIEY